jgi:hypothetical protein
VCRFTYFAPNLHTKRCLDTYVSEKGQNILYFGMEGVFNFVFFFVPQLKGLCYCRNLIPVNAGSYQVTWQVHFSSHATGSVSCGYYQLSKI